jgi:hypothetical protein
MVRGTFKGYRDPQAQKQLEEAALAPIGSAAHGLEETRS